MLSGVYKKIPKLISKKEIYEDGANCPTLVYTHECLCGKGTIDYCRVPGFSDEYCVWNCRDCKKKYHEIIDRIGDKWEVYPKK